MLYCVDCNVGYHVSCLTSTDRIISNELHCSECILKKHVRYPLYLSNYIDWNHKANSLTEQLVFSDEETFEMVPEEIVDEQRKKSVKKRRIGTQQGEHSDEMLLENIANIYLPDKEVKEVRGRKRKSVGKQHAQEAAAAGLLSIQNFGQQNEGKESVIDHESGTYC